MTNRSERISAAGALLGLVLAGLAFAGIVIGLHALVGPADQLPPLDAPGQPAASSRCADPRGTAGAPQSVTAVELIECPALFDGAQVRYTGEVVRAVLRRGERAVLQVNDDLYALSLGPLPEHRATRGGNSGIPVLLPWAIAGRIHHVGDSRHHGDLITVIGTFHQADPDDGGGPTISADTATIERPGRELPRRLDRTRVVVAALLLAVVLALAAAAQLRPRR